MNYDIQTSKLLLKIESQKTASEKPRVWTGVIYIQQRCYAKSTSNLKVVSVIKYATGL